MASFPSNRDQDDAPTMAAYFPPQLAWSSEQPEFNSAPATYPAQQSRYPRSRVLAFAGAGLVAAAAAGFFGAMYSSASSTPVNTSAQSAPKSAPAPAPMPTTQHTVPSHRTTSVSARTAGGYSAPASHQTPPTPQVQPSSGQTDQTYRDIGSDPSQWNNGGNYWFTHWRDHDSRWRGDHDSRWTFFNRDHDNDSHSTRSNDYGDSK